MHGVINPLFEDDMEFLDSVEDELNVDPLSDCYNKSDCSSSICDSECFNGATFFKHEDEVLAKVSFENELALHDKFCNILDKVRANQNFSCDYENEVLDKVVIKDQPTPCIKFNDEYFDVIDLFFDCEESVEILGLFLVIDKDSIDEYKASTHLIFS